MFTRFEYLDGWYLSCPTLGDGVARLESPAINAAFNGRVPCAEANFLSGFRRIVCERVAEQTRSALHAFRGADSVCYDLDGIREMRG